MAHNINIPFTCVTLKLLNGEQLISPINHGDSFFLNQTIDEVANKFSKAFQKAIMDEGNYLSVLKELEASEYQSDQIEVGFPAAKDKISYPAFSLVFDYFYQKTPKGFLINVPVLGVTCFAATKTDIEKITIEAIKLNFAKNNRLTNVRGIIASIWYDEVALEQTTNQFKSYSPQELVNITEINQESLLPKVAQKLEDNLPKSYGRAAELDQLYKAINGRFNKSVILVGPSGVGKTALIWELARQRKKRKLHSNIWETNASTLLKDLTDDFGWQYNFSNMAKELMTSGDFLFVRNLMELFEVGKYVGNNVSIGEYMRPFISRGEINLISEGTNEEIQHIELHHPNFLSYFQVIRLEEPTKDLEDIIVKKIRELATSEKVKIDHEAIVETLRLQKRFMPYAGFPAKPIRFLESIIVNNKKAENKKSNRITRDMVIKYFSEDSGMPEFMINPEIPMDLDAIKTTFNKNVFGQKKAVNEIVDLLGAVKTALIRAGKPMASFLFVGPTGVGKTEMAKVLSEFMFGDRNRMIRFDMSEFADPYSVLRLRGVNYFTDGLLTSAVRRQPFCVLLFDEIEKADPSFFELLLPLLGSGRLTDSKGKLVNFCSSIIIMTSNIGAAALNINKIGWKSEVDSKEVTSHFVTAVQKYFRPELFNRIDQLIPFEPLSKEVVRLVVDRELALLKKREGIKFRNLTLKIEANELDIIAEKGFDVKYGARQLQRAIRTELTIPLAKIINQYEEDEQIIVEVKSKEKELVLDVKTEDTGFETVVENLQKSMYADYASSLRNQIQNLIEGSTYIGLLSKLDMLQVEMKKDETTFWNTEAKATEYSFLLEMKDKVAAFKKEIENLEEQAGLAVMDIVPYKTELNDEMEAWEKRFYHLKVEIYAQLNQGFNKAYIYLFGTQLDEVSNFYFDLLNNKEIEYKTKTYWYNKTDYDKKIVAFRDQKLKEPLFFVERLFENGRLADTKIPADHIIVGLEIAVSGDAVFHYFEQENGMQSWFLGPQNEEAKIMVNVLNKKQFPPADIHRRKFYSKPNARRKVYPGTLVDMIYKIDKKITAEKRVGLVKDKLDEVFMQKITAEFG